MTATRHLLFHLWPVGNWRDRVAALKQQQRWELFNGVKAVSVATGPGADDICEVCEAFADDSIQFNEVDNHPVLNEMVSWDWLWQQVDGKEGAAFYCHGKGTRFSPGAGVHSWVDCMFSAALDYWPLVEKRLDQGCFAGSLRSNGYGGGSFHYSGTFYWARLDLVGQLWKDVERIRWGCEAWPGRHFNWRHGGLLFSPQPVSMVDAYSAECWNGGWLGQEWEKWKLQNQRFLTCSTGVGSARRIGPARSRIA